MVINGYQVMLACVGTLGTSTAPAKDPSEGADAGLMRQRSRGADNPLKAAHVSKLPTRSASVSCRYLGDSPPMRFRLP